MEGLSEKYINEIKTHCEKEVVDAILLGFEAYHKTMKGFLENYKQDSIGKLNLGSVLDVIYKTGVVDIKNMKGML